MYYNPGSAGSEEERRRVRGRPAPGAGDVPGFGPGVHRSTAAAADDVERTAAVHPGSGPVHPVRRGPTTESGVAASAEQVFGAPVHRASCLQHRGGGGHHKVSTFFVLSLLYRLSSI